ncbi:MAG: DUF692 domain-containing protein [Pseudomonadota bacterium]
MLDATPDRNRVDAAVPNRAGVGLKHEHHDAIVAAWEAGRVDVAWFEIHAENFMGAGGPPHRRLEWIRERFPLSVHGVGLSIGAEQGLDAAHLDRLAGVVDRYAPGLFSEHLAWSTHETHFLNDLLPVPYTREVADRVAEHIAQVQDRVGRRMLLENPSTYVRFTTSTLSEIDFLARVAERSGCGLLLDVNNVHVSATNHGYGARAYLDDFPLELVGEIHLGGHAEDADDLGDPLLIDSHDRPVVEPVWDLYAHVIETAGARPTLIEWDNDLPAWEALAAEARRANAILARHEADQEADHEAHAGAAGDTSMAGRDVVRR